MSSRDGDGHVLDHRRVQMRTPRSGNRRRFRNAVVAWRLPTRGRCGVHAVERAGCHDRQQWDPPSRLACKTRTTASIGLFSRGNAAPPCKRRARCLK
jgi:hypothetical protein